MRISGTDAMLTMLADAGVRYLFGNPGTTELPLVDALVDNRPLQYIFGLQEVPVMAMADGLYFDALTKGEYDPDLLRRGLRQALRSIAP